ncbi:MAG: hypothetical protein ACUVXI_10810 [bacterium]
MKMLRVVLRIVVYVGLSTIAIAFAVRLPMSGGSMTQIVAAASAGIVSYISSRLGGIWGMSSDLISISFLFMIAMIFLSIPPSVEVWFYVVVFFVFLSGLLQSIIFGDRRALSSPLTPAVVLLSFVIVSAFIVFSFYRRPKVMGEETVHFIERVGAYLLLYFGIAANNWGDNLSLAGRAALVSLLVLASAELVLAIIASI